jgi:hypothetical protein
MIRWKTENEGTSYESISAYVGKTLIADFYRGAKDGPTIIMWQSTQPMRPVFEDAMRNGSLPVSYHSTFTWHVESTKEAKRLVRDRVRFAVERMFEEGESDRALLDDYKRRHAEGANS